METIKKLIFKNAISEIITLNIIVFIFLSLISTLIPSIYPFIISQFVAPLNLNILLVKPWTLLVCGFTHEDLFHIFSNLWVLFALTEILIRGFNYKQLWNLFILGSITGSLFAIIILNIIPISNPAVLEIATMRGASCGLSAIIMAVCYRFPLLPINLFFINTTLKWLNYINIISSILMIVFGFNAGGGIAHIGGALFGYWYIVQLDKKNDLGKILNVFLYPFKRVKN